MNNFPFKDANTRPMFFGIFNYPAMLYSKVSIRVFHQSSSIPHFLCKNKKYYLQINSFSNSFTLLTFYYFLFYHTNSIAERKNTPFSRH